MNRLISLIIFSFVSIFNILIFTSCTKQPDIQKEEALKNQEIHNTIQYTNLILEDSNYDEAIRVLEETAKKNPNHIELIESLAFAHANNNNYAEAALYFKELARLDPSQKSMLLFAAQAHIQDQNDLEATETFNEYLGFFPDDPASWKKLAKTYIRLKKPQSAIQAYLNAIADTKGYPTGIESAEIGALFFQLDNIKQAEDWYEIALGQKDDGRALALIGLLQVHAAQNNWQSVQKHIFDLDKEFPMLASSPEISSIRSNLKKWQLNSKAKQQSKTKTLPKEDLPVAKAEISQPKFSDSIFDEKEDVKTITSENIVPQIISTLPQEIQSVSTLDNSEESIDNLWKAVGGDRTNPQTWHQLSLALYKNKDFKNAEATILEASRLDPSNEKLALHYINVIQNTFTEDHYISEINKISDKFPNNPNITLALAKAYESTNPRNAQFLYKEFLNLAPKNHPERQRIEIKLAQAP